MAEEKASLGERAVDVGTTFLSALWMVAAIAIGLCAVFSKFIFFDTEIAAEIKLHMGEITLALVATTSLGWFATMHKLVKAHKKESLSVSTALNAATQNSGLLDALVGLSEAQRDDVISYVSQQKEMTKTLNASSDSVRRILSAHHSELKARLEALSVGRFDLPLDESPAVNYEIIETFGGRMDAVSRDHLDFWEKELGKRYFEECTKARGRCDRAVLSRIFILRHKSIAADKVRLSNILKKHLEANVGFAIVIHESLTPTFMYSHSIREGREADTWNNNENRASTTLDFALFNKNMALTSFRNSASEKVLYNQNGKRFKALFRVGESGTLNNEVLQLQRKLWVALIAEAWLVSSDFMPIIGTGVSADEMNFIKQKAWEGTEAVKRAVKLDPDDQFFPFVVQEDSHIEQKLKQLDHYYHAWSDRLSRNRANQMEKLLTDNQE